MQTAILALFKCNMYPWWFLSNSSPSRPPSSRRTTKLFTTWNNKIIIAIVTLLTTMTTFNNPLMTWRLNEWMPHKEPSAFISSLYLFSFVRLTLSMYLHRDLLHWAMAESKSSKRDTLCCWLAMPLTIQSIVIIWSHLSALWTRALSARSEA